MSNFRLESVGNSIGCIIHGPDLRQLTHKEISSIKKTLKEHLVVFFRNQQLTVDSSYRLAGQLGEPTIYPFVEGIDGIPEVVEIVKHPKDKVNFGGVWHSDTAYLEKPAMGALLYGLETPKQAGDTLFANMYAVFESLSPGLRQFLLNLRAINDADKSAISRTRPGGIKKGLKAIHPVVRTHPETERKLLYVNRAHTTRFEGWTEVESQPLLEFLCQKIEEPRFGCRFNWEPGTLAFWDNRACQHFPINDYDGQLRRMLRVSLAGDKPF